MSRWMVLQDRARSGAREVRDEFDDNWGWLLLLLLASRPRHVMLGLVWTLAAYTVLSSLCLVGIGLKLRPWTTTRGARG